MKRLILILICFFAVITVNAQFKGFFKPVESQSYFQAKEITADRNLNGIFLIRMSAGIAATQTMYDFNEKTWSQSALSVAGFGLSFSHYKEIAGQPYNNWSVNGFLFVNEYISVAVTGSMWQYFQAGVIYTPELKRVGLLTGLKYNF